MNETQKRIPGEILKKSDFDKIEKINPYTQMQSNPCKRKGKK